MQSEIFNNKTLNNILKKNKIFVPATIVIHKLIEEKKASEVRSASRFISETTYTFDSDAALNCAKDIVKMGCVLCESNPHEKKTIFPSFDQVFEDFVTLSEEEIIILSPFVSVDLSSDLKKSLGPKKEIISIITNSPDSILVQRDLHKKLIAELYKKGFNIKVCQNNFHAKAYLFDKKAAIIGSSNFSRQGFFANNELGVILFGEKVLQIRRWIDRLLE